MWLYTQPTVPFKADSHIAYRSHDAPMPFPCCAAKGLECVFPIWFTQCDCVWFKLATPCPCHVPTMPFFSRPQHSTAVKKFSENSRRHFKIPGAR